MPRVRIHDSYNWPPRTYADIVEAEDDACTSLSDIVSGWQDNPQVPSWELDRINTILCSDFMRESPPEGEGGN